MSASPSPVDRGVLYSRMIPLRLRSRYWRQPPSAGRASHLLQSGSATAGVDGRANVFPLLVGTLVEPGLDQSSPSGVSRPSIQINRRIGFVGVGRAMTSLGVRDEGLRGTSGRDSPLQRPCSRLRLVLRRSAAAECRCARAISPLTIWMLATSVLLADIPETARGWSCAEPDVRACWYRRARPMPAAPVVANPQCHSKAPPCCAARAYGRRRSAGVHVLGRAIARSSPAALPATIGCPKASSIGDPPLHENVGVHYDST